MLRKVTATMACVAAAALVAACGSSGTSTSKTSASKSTSGKKVAVVLGVKGFEYYTSLGCGAQAEGKKLGLDVSVEGPTQFTATAEIPIVNAVTAKRPDAAIVAPDDAHALVPPLKQMMSAGIKLVQVDTATEPPLGETQITSNNAQAGSLGAKTLAKIMGDKGSVLIVSTAPGVTTEDARIKAFTAEMKKHPGITVMSPQYDGANPEKSTSVISGVLSAHPDLGGIFTTNLLSTAGAETALRQTHTGGKVKFVGSDGAAKQLADLKADVMQGIILQMPFKEGQLAVDAVNDVLGGKTAPAPRQVGVVSLTKDNLSTNAKFIYQSHC